jgi:hypothetical protein
MRGFYFSLKACEDDTCDCEIFQLIIDKLNSCAVCLEYHICFSNVGTSLLISHEVQSLALECDHFLILTKNKNENAHSSLKSCSSVNSNLDPCTVMIFETT